MSTNREEDIVTDDSGKKKVPSITIILEIVFYIAFFIAAINVIPRYICERVDVSGPSMKNTLENGDKLIGWKLKKNYDRFDIVFFNPEEHPQEEDYIKRIIGLPGETVKIDEDGIIYINGEVLQEDFGKAKIKNPGLAANPITLGEDEYFVLGDNRNNSTDSRKKIVGNVKESDIDGIAVFRVWPLSKFGSIK